MSIEEKRRAAFEAYCLGEGFSSYEIEVVRGEYRAPIIRHMWDSWSAALDSVVIELPKKVEAPWSYSYDAGISATAKCIEAAGLKVKP